MFGLPTFGPYGDCPFSSLFWRTLWKSYLFSWRTKLAKLLCLKCLGRIVLVNFSHCAMVSADRQRDRQRAATRERERAHLYPYLQDDKTIPLITPAHNFRVRRVLQHPFILRQSEHESLETVRRRSHGFLDKQRHGEPEETHSVEKGGKSSRE